MYHYDTWDSLFFYMDIYVLSDTNSFLYFEIIDVIFYFSKKNQDLVLFILPSHRYRNKARSIFPIIFSLFLRSTVYGIYLRKCYHLSFTLKKSLSYISQASDNKS